MLKSNAISVKSTFPTPNVWRSMFKLCIANLSLTFVISAITNRQGKPCWRCTCVNTLEKSLISEDPMSLLCIHNNQCILISDVTSVTTRQVTTTRCDGIEWGMTGANLTSAHIANMPPFKATHSSNTSWRSIRISNKPSSLLVNNASTSQSVLRALPLTSSLLMSLPRLSMR